MVFLNLPTRNECQAPTFDDSRPEELERYFSDLEILFDRHAITDHQERKRAAVQYLKIHTESLWKTEDSYSDQTKTYADFKADIYKLYPEASRDWTYTIRNLDLLTEHYARTGILSAADLGNYYRRFLLISRYLISKGRIAVQDQSRSFLRGLQPTLLAQVQARLQLKFMDHFHDDPYELSAIYEAIIYVLMWTVATPSAQPPPAPEPFTSSSPSDPISARLDVLASEVTSITAMVQSAFPVQQAGNQPKSASTAASGINASNSSCGRTGTFVPECDTVSDFIKAGKYKKNEEGKIVLPTGAMVPRSNTGAFRTDRVDEKHRQEPRAAGNRTDAPPNSGSNDIPKRCGEPDQEVHLGPASALSTPSNGAPLSNTQKRPHEPERLNVRKYSKRSGSARTEEGCAPGYRTKRVRQRAGSRPRYGQSHHSGNTGPSGPFRAPHHPLDTPAIRAQVTETTVNNESLEG